VRSRSLVATRDLYERTRLFALAVIRFCRTLPQTREAQEAASQLRRVDWLEDLRDAGIAHDDALLQEARELAAIFAKAVHTARVNTKRLRKLPGS
jgi:hypothetical protein